MTRFARPRHRESGATRHRRSRTTARLGVLVAFLRALVMVSVFQLSGAAHLAGDLVEFITLGHHPDIDAEHENDPTHDCPPGCPTCHHVHYSGAALPPTLLVPVAWVPLSEGVTVEWKPSADAPSGPPHASVYRPPRT